MFNQALFSHRSSNYLINCMRALKPGRKRCRIASEMRGMEPVFYTPRVHRSTLRKLGAGFEAQSIMVIHTFGGHLGVTRYLLASYNQKGQRVAIPAGWLVNPCSNLLSLSLIFTFFQKATSLQLGSYLETPTNGTRSH